MRQRKAVFSSLWVFLFLFVSISGVVFASSENWVEVARFTGGIFDDATESFLCDHVEWRIRWEFDVGHWHFPELYGLTFTIIAQKDPQDYISSYVVNSVSSSLLDGRNGTSYIYDDNGEFHITIHPGILDNYSIIIEQNTDSRSILEISNNWVEIATYTGVTEGVRNEFFTSDCDEWRIRWSYNPKDASIAPQLQFNYTIDEVDGEFSETLIPEDDRGIMYIQKAGSFNLTIHSHALRYSLTVEKNLEFIPEFPSWIILPLFLTATVLALLVRKRMNGNSGL